VHEPAPGGGPTDGLANWIAAPRFDDIPTAAIERIKLLMLDSFGCALFTGDPPAAHAGGSA